MCDDRVYCTGLIMYMCANAHCATMALNAIILLHGCNHVDGKPQQGNSLHDSECIHHWGTLTAFMPPYSVPATKQVRRQAALKLCGTPLTLRHATLSATLQHATLPAGYPLLDNILAPTAAGASNISSSFAAAVSRRFGLTVKDTYQQAWPAAAPLSDTSARVDANMSEAHMLVTYLMVPSVQLDVRASPPVMPSLSEVQAGALGQESCAL